MNTREVRIALAATTASYMPLYWSIYRLNQSAASPWISLERGEGEHAPPTAYGDRDAYRRLFARNNNKHPAHIAICDPMVVAEEADAISTAGIHRDTTGVIVAFLMRRPALWGLSRSSFQHQPGKAGESRSFPYKTINERKLALNQVAVYNNCTASFLVDAMRGGERPFWDYNCTVALALGEEWQYASGSKETDAIIKLCAPAAPRLASTVSPNATAIAQSALCVTCDVLLARACTSSDDPRTVFSWMKFHDVPDFPFTAVVVRRNWLATMEGLLATCRLLREIQGSVDNLLGGISEPEMKKYFAVYITTMDPESTVVDDNLELDTNETKDCKKIFNDAIRDLCEDRGEFGQDVRAYPRSIRPDWSKPWIRSGWRYSSSTLWGLRGDFEDASTARLFRRCTTSRLAPRTLTGYSRSLYWLLTRRALRVEPILFGIIGTFLVTLLIAMNNEKFLAAIHVFGKPYGSHLQAVLTEIWSPSDMISLALVLIVWCIAYSAWVGVRAWLNIAFPALEGTDRKTKYLRVGTFLILVVTSPLAVMSAIGRSFKRLGR